VIGPEVVWFCDMWCAFQLGMGISE